MRPLLLSVFLLGLIALTGCVDTGIGTILGVETYYRVADESAFLVPNGYVALYAAADTTTPLQVLQTDDLGRFNFQVEEGMYAVAGSTHADGPFTGLTGAFDVFGHATSQVIFPITEATAGAPVITAIIKPETIATATTAVFDVTVTNGVRYYWDFGTGVTPATSNEKAPTITAGAPGDYNGAVTVANDDGTSLPFPFTYTVSPSEVTP
ncbi:MAG: PKD domain-containing protein [bacterium]